MDVTTSESYWHGNLKLWRGGSKYVCVCVCIQIHSYTHIWQHTHIHTYTWLQRHLLRTLRKLRACPKNAGMHTPGHLVTTSYLILGNSGSSDDYEHYSLRCWFSLFMALSSGYTAELGHISPMADADASMHADASPAQISSGRFPKPGTLRSPSSEEKFAGLTWWDNGSYLGDGNQVHQAPTVVTKHDHSRDY